MDNKLSIIIPTMQKNTTIFDMLVSQLVKDDTIGEIIIIDNSLKGYSFDSEKVFVHIPKENMYVNPSWNYGVQLAKFNYIGILNDDVLIPNNLCSEVLNFLKETENVGVVGIESSSVINKNDKEFNSYPNCTTQIKFKNLNNIRENKNYYWGSAIFGPKENFYQIPEKILVYCGDDYYLLMNTKNGKQNYAFYNTSIFHCHSLTSASPEFSKIKKNDMKIYSKFDPEFKKYLQRKRFSKFIQQIFSVKNAKHKSHKILTILGIKIKLKRK